jgi:hypothetical protein
MRRSSGGTRRLAYAICIVNCIVNINVDSNIEETSAGEKAVLALHDFVGIGSSLKMSVQPGADWMGPNRRWWPAPHRAESANVQFLGIRSLWNEAAFSS